MIFRQHRVKIIVNAKTIANNLKLIKSNKFISQTLARFDPLSYLTSTELFIELFISRNYKVSLGLLNQLWKDSPIYLYIN